MTCPSNKCYILRLRKDILGLRQFLKLKYLCGSYRGSELRVSAKGKGEFLIPQEMCGGLHTHDFPLKLREFLLRWACPEISRLVECLNCL